MNETYERIATELSRSLKDGTSSEPARKPRPTAWEEDYDLGKRKIQTQAFAPRLALVGGGDSGGAGGDLEENFGLRGPISAFKSELAGWCVGTKVFLVCIAVAAFIVVV
jgi:hypothetical protein